MGAAVLSGDTLRPLFAAEDAAPTLPIDLGLLVRDLTGLDPERRVGLSEANSCYSSSLVHELLGIDLCVRPSSISNL